MLIIVMGIANRSIMSIYDVCDQAELENPPKSEIRPTSPWSTPISSQLCKYKIKTTGFSLLLILIPIE